MKHNYRLGGPDITGPFTVVKGLVAVYGEVSVALPPGATWPGLAQLPDWLAEQLLPQEADIVTGTVVHTHPPTPREIEAGIALLHAQLLQGSQLSLTQRIDLVGRLVPPRSVNQGTLAALIGGARASIAKAMPLYTRPRP